MGCRGAPSSRGNEGTKVFKAWKEGIYEKKKVAELLSDGDTDAAIGLNDDATDDNNWDRNNAWVEVIG